MIFRRLQIPPNLTNQSPAAVEEMPDVSDKQKKDVKDAALLAAAGSAVALVEAHTQAVVKEVVQPLYTIAQASLDASCLKDVTKLQNDAIGFSAEVTLLAVKI